MRIAAGIVIVCIAIGEWLLGSGFLGVLIAEVVLGCGFFLVLGISQWRNNPKNKGIIMSLIIFVTAVALIAAVVIVGASLCADKTDNGGVGANTCGNCGCSGVIPENGLCTIRL